MKVLIVGLDGATWDVLDGDLLSSHMPNLSRLLETGSYGVLDSTIPAMTPAAWTTCISGCQPHTHGLASFQQYSYSGDMLYYTSSADIQVPTMWHYLSEKGYRVASINVPMTYPVYPINGYMISGLGCPGTSCEFVYPPEFKERLLEKIPDYGISMGLNGFCNSNEGFGKTKDQFEEAIQKIERCFETRLEAARLIQSESPVDVMMVQFQQIDFLQHCCWPYVDAKTRDQYPWHRDRLFGLYGQLDRIIGQLLEGLDSSGLCIVVSDHGFGPTLYNLNINRFLEEWGYVRRAELFGRMIRRTRRNLMKYQKHGDLKISVSMKVPVNWSKTKAMVLLRPTQGILFVNVKGRQPEGCVEPGREYESVIGDLKQRLKSLTNPYTGEHVFDSVETPQEVYGSEAVDCETFGDLILRQKAHYRMCISLKQSRSGIEPAPSDSFNASWHYGNGLFAISGKGIRSNNQIKAHIADIAPTLYAWLGLSIPAEVDGQAIRKAFSDEVVIQRQRECHFPASYEQGRSFAESCEADQAALEEQYKNLGYL